MTTFYLPHGGAASIGDTFMATSTDRESAKIYQFPVRVRPPYASHFETAKPLTVTSLPQFSGGDGGGWYHEAAVREADRALKR